MLFRYFCLFTNKICYALLFLFAIQRQVDQNKENPFDTGRSKAFVKNFVKCFCWRSLLYNSVSSLDVTITSHFRREQKLLKFQRILKYDLCFLSSTSKAYMFSETNLCKTKKNIYAFPMQSIDKVQYLTFSLCPQSQNPLIP